jgi:hypothetical protein
MHRHDDVSAAIRRGRRHRAQARAAELMASAPDLVEVAEVAAGCLFRAPSPSLQDGQLAERIEAASAAATLKSP